MFQDLLDTQDAPLERFLFTSIIPSLLITSLLHFDAVWGWHRPRVHHQLAVHQKTLPPHGDSWMVREGPASGVEPPYLFVRVGPARAAYVIHYNLFGRHVDIQDHRQIPVFFVFHPFKEHGSLLDGPRETLWVRAVVDRDGSVMPETPRVFFSTADPALRAAAIEVVRLTMFYPPRMDGVGQEAIVEIPVEFIIPNLRGGHVRHPH